ncbi:class I SAM-dependent methyltransferase [Marinigracilibium pacificum]|uniref:Class I SAM-dependent methyltransferase n=1 Tax=Marinigracilibium pacificum TaxID=2729599 RepID=A0A848IXL1_9BACT|nr:class I SAM-dependent methyltransferase [Marinigracilibium pacificum]NMM47010.1 class I SAM-dependent methyltransferase [Marinigracilibium pacificum]
MSFLDNGIGLFGNTDVYLIDLIIKGKFNLSQKILDVGCGEGRNLKWFLQNRFDVYGVDLNPAAIRMIQMYAASIDGRYKNEKERFIIGSAGDLPFAPAQFDVIIHSAVAHFAKDKTEFIQWWEESIKVLKPDGILFMRTSITYLQKNRDNDTPFSFIPDYDLINSLVSEHKLIEPIKIVEVPAKGREMGVIVLKKQSN